MTRSGIKLAIKKLSELGLHRSAIGIFMLGVAVGVGYEEFVGVGTWYSFHLETDKVNVCFTPPVGCGGLIVQEIAKAKDTIYVQAYNFTSQSIANQLIKAKKRGVKVFVLLDQSNMNDHYSQISELQRAGIEVRIDRVNGIAHNKIIIIDERKVLTGSYNFSKAADQRNVENLVLIEDKQVAEIYLKNWLSRQAQSY
jgi:phospholipase D